jgi:SAM-dependent methyltransferase
METEAAKQERLYTDLAWTWPIISPWEEYIEETELFVERIKAASHDRVETVLNLGCGGGHNDNTLKNHFQVTGLDLSERMLDLARSLNAECTYLHGDMRTARLGTEFDAVLVFDSLAHMLSKQDLKAAFETAFTHLKPGGVFCTYREFASEKFVQNTTTATVHSDDGVEIVFIENYYDPDPHDSTFESTTLYLIRREGELKIESQQGLIGLFPLETWTCSLTEVGFDVLPSEQNWNGCDFFSCLKSEGG